MHAANFITNEANEKVFFKKENLWDAVFGKKDDAMLLVLNSTGLWTADGVVAWDNVENLYFNTALSNDEKNLFFCIKQKNDARQLKIDLSSANISAEEIKMAVEKILEDIPEWRGRSRQYFNRSFSADF